MARIGPVLLVALLPAGAASAYDTPAKGTGLRADLMDALRPIAEWQLGAPFEFVVTELRVSGDAAFASVTAQRPGGGRIDMATTPMARRNGYDPQTDSGPMVQALLRRSGPGWVPVEYAISPTDVWWAWDEYCPLWAAVLPEVCR